MSTMILRQYMVPRSSLEPPAAQSRQQMNPTLIVSWWCTLYALIVILVRVAGRWVRTERLFREDKVMLYSIIPLFARMALVHVILTWGTNNITLTELTPEQIDHRTIGSKLVLASRILYATYIWIAKVTVLEFIQRIIGQTWTKFYHNAARLIYVFLGLSFIAVVISTLAECQPFSHYWQVVPDPGPQCRTGQTQLITMGVCDIVTNLILVVFPIPLIMMARMPLKKKVSLCSLFLLSLILIAITSYRIPAVIERHYAQHFRTLIASIEILAASCVANAVVIGSFLRDKGVKKAKFRADSPDESVVNQDLSRVRSKPVSVMGAHWGSDEDLVRDLGMTVDPELRHKSRSTHRPAQPTLSLLDEEPQDVEPTINPQGRGLIDPRWTFRRGTVTAGRGRQGSDASSLSSTSTDIKLQELHNSTRRSHDDNVTPSAPASPYKKMNFFDVGGLIDNPRSEDSSLHEHSRRMSQNQQSITRNRANFLSDVGGLFGQHSEQHEESHPATAPQSSLAPAEQHVRDRSRSPLTRLGQTFGHGTEKRIASRQAQPLPANDTSADLLDFSDAGGLLR